jgi:hypothetical protein
MMEWEMIIFVGSVLAGLGATWQNIFGVQLRSSLLIQSGLLHDWNNWTSMTFDISFYFLDIYTEKRICVFLLIQCMTAWSSLLPSYRFELDMELPRQDLHIYWKPIDANPKKWPNHGSQFSNFWMILVINFKIFDIWSPSILLEPSQFS